MLRHKSRLLLEHLLAPILLHHHHHNVRLMSRASRMTEMVRQQSMAFEYDENTEELDQQPEELEHKLQEYEQTHEKIVDYGPSDYLGIRPEEDLAAVHGDYGFLEQPTKEARYKAQELLLEKYRPLLERPPPKRPNPSVVAKTTYGQMRLDSENRPRYHGQFERLPKIPVSSSHRSVGTVIRHLNEHNVALKPRQPTEEEERFARERAEKQLAKAKQIVDEHIQKAPLIKGKKQPPPDSLVSTKIKFKFTEEFRRTQKEAKAAWRAANPKPVVENPFDGQQDWIEYERSKRDSEPLKGAPLDPERALSDLTDEEILLKMTQVKLEDFEKGGKKSKKSSTTETNADVEEDFEMPQTEVISGEDYLKQIYSGERKPLYEEEYDVMKKLVSNKDQLDTKGYRILSNQVPDYGKMTNDEVVAMLEKLVLFNDADIVALNKPYGMSVHGGRENLSTIKDHNGVALNLRYFLPALAEKLGAEKLLTVHRLDRDTTGVLLLAKTQEKAKVLADMFFQQKIQKQYICITKSVPTPERGIIEIPIEVGYVKTPGGQKRERMVLCPEAVENVRKGRRPGYAARFARTSYQVLDKSHKCSAALVRLTPETGIRHQIRVHLGFGLRSPILGDHKYSSLDSLAPQKLPSDILSCLRVRQQKVRHVPMHLHAYTVMVPGAGAEGRNVFLRAPLPHHFRKNMSSLKLQMP